MGEVDDNLIEDDPDTIQPSVDVRSRQVAEQSAHTIKSNTSEYLAPTDSERDANATAIFNYVVKVFNEALPDFIQRSVDPEAQKKQLLDGLSEDLKNYIERLNLAARKEGQRLWDAEKNKLSANLRELESRTREFEEQRSLLSQKQLSADRQKRALADKVRDLETKILSLEAEKEQYQLENKSLLNKLKVASVYESENAELRKAVAEKGVNPDTLAAKSAEDAKLREENQKLDAELSSLKEELEKTKEELKQAIATADGFKTEVDHLKEEIENMSDEIPEAMAEKLREIESQVALFEDIKARKDQKIAELSSELQAAQEKIVNLDKVVNMNIESQSKNEQKYRDQIEELRQNLAKSKEEVVRLEKQLNESIAKAARENRQSQKVKGEKTQGQRPDMNAGTPIEDILGDTDWMISSGALRRDNENRKQNKRKDTPDNDQQLSLF